MRRARSASSGRPFSTSSVIVPVARSRIVVQTRVADCGDDPAVRHAQLRRTRARSARSGGPPTVASVRLGPPRRCTAMPALNTLPELHQWRLAGPVHLAVAEAVEDQDLLPGGRQSGGEDHSISSRIGRSVRRRTARADCRSCCCRASSARSAGICSRPHAQLRQAAAARPRGRRALRSRAIERLDGLAPASVAGAMAEQHDGPARPVPPGGPRD